MEEKVGHSEETSVRLSGLQGVRKAGEGERRDLQYCCRVSPLCAEKYKCSICYLEIIVTGQYLFDSNIILKLDCVGLDAYYVSFIITQTWEWKWPIVKGMQGGTGRWMTDGQRVRWAARSHYPSLMH